MSPHRAVFVDLVKQYGWTRGAELGVDKAILFNMLLMACPTLHLIGVDIGVVPKRLEQWQSIVDDFPDRAVMHVMTTHEASALVPDASLQFAFLDGDHSEAAVADDIACWAPKIQRGGWLGGHDYNQDFPGVVAAVNRAFGKRVKTWQGPKPRRGASIWGVWQ